MPFVNTIKYLSFAMAMFMSTSLLSGCQTQSDGQSIHDLEANPRLRIGQETQPSPMTESERDQTRMNVGILGVLNAISR